LLEEVSKFGYEVKAPFQIGDILLFVYGKCVSHAGIYIGDDKMIHAYRRNGVVESSIKYYETKFHSAWRVKTDV
jgi:cell wall-associated NlpC family hydrolase